ncbi:MAG: ComEC/Rec2 family competence protein [Prevotella sp.]|nr:ComEC/Rec2 family competence protein [Prevotella sp.]
MLDSRNYPLVCCTSTFILGVFLFREHLSCIPSWALLAGFCGMVIASVAFVKRAVVSAVLLLSAVFLMGGWLVTRFENGLRKTFPEGPVSYQGIVASQPQQHGKVMRFDLLIVSRGDPFLVKASLLNDSITGRAKQLKVGDGMKAFSLLEEPVSGGAGSSYMDSRRLHVQGFSGTTLILSRNWKAASVSLETVSFFQRTRLKLLRLREQVRGEYAAAGVVGEALTILSAMTLGDKNGLTREMKRVFAAAGVGHLLALSGMHLGILYGFLLVCFHGRRFRFVGQSVALSVIWCYVFFVGMPFSVVRSAIMCTVYGLAFLLNRGRASLNVLAFAALLILVFYPLSLWDVGFQLSFMAVWGILLVNGMQIRFSSAKVIQHLCSALLVSLGAQMTVLPLVMLYFGRVPVYFLLTNLLAVFVSPVIIVGAVILLLLAVVGAFHAWVAAVLSYVITAFYQFLCVIAAFPYATLSVSLSPMQAVLFYILLACLFYLGYRASDRWQRRQ